MPVAPPHETHVAPVAKSGHDADAIRRRTLALLRTNIDFVPNPGFELAEDCHSEIVNTTLRAANHASASATPGQPAYLRGLCELELLTPEQETALFRQMNLLKFRANKLQARLDPDRPQLAAVEEIESLLASARQIRDHLIKANMRLVMSIAKKFVTPQRSFDDALSDGAVTLMQAVEKFDYDRGFRFSTYAYRSIARDAYRSIMTAQKESAHYFQTSEEWALDQQEDRSSSAMHATVWSHLRTLSGTMLQQLDRRERFIIRSRYALGAHRKVRTFQYLADKLGVSKERVRQLEHRAVEKLRSMAQGLDSDELFGASLA